MSLALLPNSNSLRILIICDSVNFDLFMTVNLIIYYIFKLSEKWGSLPMGGSLNDFLMGNVLRASNQMDNNDVHRLFLAFLFVDRGCKKLLHFQGDQCNCRYN